MRVMKSLAGVLVVLFLAFIVNVSRADVSSNFNTGLDGWTNEGNGTLSYVSTGGNPGGYARYTDVAGTSGDGWMIAPAAFFR